MSVLPAGFASLAPFMEQWALASAAERAQARNDSTEAERLAFYEAAKPLLAPALALLDQKPLAALDESDKRLMNLMLSLAHASLAVEIQADDEAKHALQRQHLRITRAPADA
jgi:hypothetical protein